MSQITYSYLKLRKNFGHQPLFQSIPAHMIDSICEDTSQQKQYCLRNPVHRAVQATLSHSENEASTKKVILRNVGINHVEGGWPKDVHLNNEDHVMRYKRRVCHEDNYIHTVNTAAPVMEHYIDQNNAVEMYQTYFKEIPRRNPVETYQIRVANSFAGETDRPVSCLAWTNETQSKLAVAYSSRSYGFSTKVFDFDVCYVWDVENQCKPFSELYPSSPCWQLACSPSDPSIIIGGLQDGTVSLFDVRAKVEALICSSQYTSHKCPITSLLYTNSRTNTEFFTGSLDGDCFWWDIRHITQPMDKLSISIREPNKEGISALQFDRGFPTKFLCGTESGLVVNVNRLGRTQSEILSSYWEAHTGPVRAVHSSPCTHRMFITCGDWSVRIWSEEVRTDPIIAAKPYPYAVSDVAWAPLRWSSYMAVCVGGHFYYWDLLRKHHEPIFKQLISKNQLTKVTPHNDGSNIAIGDSNGSVYLIQLCESMIWPGSADKHLTQQLYDRERKREHILEARVKEIRLRQKMEEEVVDEIVEVDEEEMLRLTEEEYFRMVKKTISEEM